MREGDPGDATVCAPSRRAARPGPCLCRPPWPGPSAVRGHGEM